MRNALITAFMLIEVDIGHEIRALEKLGLIPGIEEVHLVYGLYDIIAKIEAKNLRELNQIIFEKVRYSET